MKKERLHRGPIRIALSRKLKGSTLMETLVATVLIVLIFMLASGIINGLYRGSMENSDAALRQELLFLEYSVRHGGLDVPHQTEFGPWEIQVFKEQWNGRAQTVFSAVHVPSQRKLIHTVPNSEAP